MKQTPSSFSGILLFAAEFLAPVISGTQEPVGTGDESRVDTDTTLHLGPSLSCSLLIVLAILGPTPRAHAQSPVAVGGELQINTYTTNGQQYPEVTVGGSGDFVVVWQSVGSAGDDNDEESIQGRRFSSSGSALGIDFQVNSQTARYQQRPSAAMNTSGDFVVAWHSYNSSIVYRGDIRSQRYDSSGNALGGELAVNSYTTDFQGETSVVMNAAGDFVVVWQSNIYGNLDIQGQRFNSSGSALGGELAVNSPNSYLGLFPSIAMSAAGDFVVVWQSYGSVGNDDSSSSIQGRRFSSSGSALGDDFQVNSYTTSAQRHPSVVMNAAGDFVVVWDTAGSAGNDSSGYSIQGQRFDSSGNALGGEFQINSYTTGDQSAPSAAMDAAGNLIVVWDSAGSAGNDNSLGSIQGRVFSSSGSALGDEFQINTHTTGDQLAPWVASHGSSDFVVAWQSYGSPGDSSSWGIRAQRFQASGAVGDRVWIDEDGDGLQGAGEPGISGVGVDLYDDLSVLVDSAVTDVDGDYLFTDVLPGDYFLDFALPADFLFTLQNAGDGTLDSNVDASGRTAIFTVTTGVVDLDQDAGLVYFVGDRVWRDGNANGIQDGGEQGVEGVTVTLFTAGGVQVGQALTDAEGLYSIPAALGDDYYLHFALPPDEAFALRDVGADDTIDSDAASDGLTVVFSVVGSDTSHDAGLVSAPTGIGDRVWLDTDLDGVQDGGEAGVAGVSVELFTFAGVSQGTTTTAADGSYGFTGLTAGSYYLSFSEPVGFCYTAQDQGGADSRDSDVDPLTRTTGEIVLADGQNDVTWDAGLVPDASVGNRVWLDDGDGIQGGGEAGVQGVTVRLYDALGAQLDETMTDPDGNYSFAPGPGEYYLEYVLPPDTAFAPRDQGSDDTVDSDAIAASGTTVVFSLGPGAVDATRDAGLEPAVIGNRVWQDINRDGRQQPGEPGIAGVTVRLLDELGAEVAQASTDADGIYGFLGVASGNYRIEVIPPAGLPFSPQNIGGNDLIDSDVDPSTGRSALFDYSVGGASRSHDAGLIVVIFADGFDSGNTSAWSSTVP